MKITICGSIKFAKNFVDIYHQLEKLGHQPMMAQGMFDLANGSAAQLIDAQNGLENHEIKKKYNVIKWWHNCIISGDAILVLNYDKNGIKNYIGGNALMEMGFAHVNDKKIFLLNPVPEELSYKDEIKAMADMVINGDLNKIS
jgi:hypothetical protein